MATKKSPPSVKKAAAKNTSPSKNVVNAKAKTSAVKKRASSKSASKLAPSLSLESNHSPTEPEISHDEISLRAYFISERRHQMGWEGDSHTDWLEATSQLRAETIEKTLKKR